MNYQKPKIECKTEGKAVCQICKNTNHTAIQCWHRFDHSNTDEEILEALAALDISSNTDYGFYADSWEISHMTNDPGKICKAYSYSGKDAIYVGNGNSLPLHVLVVLILKQKVATWI